MRLLPGQYASYDAPSTEWIARYAGIRPEDVVRFDGNTSPRPPPYATPDALVGELARIHTYPHGGYPRIAEAIAEYAGDTARDLIEDDVIVIRTFSKAFALAGARVGYALAGREVAEELNRRQHPAPLSTLSVALALAALEQPPDVAPIVAERERLAEELRRIGLDPWPSRANFLYVPLDGAEEVGERLLRRGLPVRRLPGAIRVTIRNQPDDDRLVAALRST